MILFEKESEYNGTVRVVAHGPWRSLRFNGVEQGLTYVFEDVGVREEDSTDADGGNRSNRGGDEEEERTGKDVVNKEDDGTTTMRVSGNSSTTPTRRRRRNGDADVDVLGYEYLRSMTAAAATMCRLDGELCLLSAGTGTVGVGGQRVICVGLGSGAMPAFIAKHFPNTTVEVIEIDPVVVEAVNDHHGLTVPHRKAAMGASEDWAGGGSGDHREGHRHNLGMVMGDAAEFMSQAAAAVAAGAAPPAAAVLLVGTIGVFWFPGGLELGTFGRAR